MGKTSSWLIRGAVVAALAVLVVAWAVGIVGVGDWPWRVAESLSPAWPEGSTTPAGRRWAVVEVTPRRAGQADPSEDAVIEFVSDTAGAPPWGASSARAPIDLLVTRGPRSVRRVVSLGVAVRCRVQPARSSAPSGPPNQLVEECTALGDVLDCVLDPITGSP